MFFTRSVIDVSLCQFYISLTSPSLAYRNPLNFRCDSPKTIGEIKSCLNESSAILI